MLALLNVIRNETGLVRYSGIIRERDWNLRLEGNPKSTQHRDCLSARALVRKSELPDIYHGCYDYYDPFTNLHLNRYRETCTELYYDVQEPASLPTLPMSPTHVSTFLDSFDVINHQRSIQAALHNMPTSYRRLYKLVVL